MASHDHDQRPTITALAILGALMLVFVLSIALSPKTSKKTLERLNVLEQHTGLSEASK